MKYTEDELIHPTKQWIKVSQGIFHLPISAQAKILLMVLIGFYRSNKTGVHPSRSYLAKTIGIKSKKMVTKYLKEIQSLGMLEWEQKTLNGSSHYYFDLDMKCKIRNKKKSKGGEKNPMGGAKRDSYKDINLLNIINLEERKKNGSE
tara:strand:- start:1704 stop:2144 length:441 start_codon:yes stop_codon:yes gene_type:complete